MNQEIDIRKKLSINGIFIIYNFSLIKKHPPFWIALIISLIYLISSLILSNNQKDFADFLTNKIDSLFPNLIGFSLGGYAIIVAFGNTDFLKKIAKSGKPYYEELNAIFAFSILLQVLVLFISLIAEIYVEILKNIKISLDYNLYQIGNLCFNSLTLFFIIWSLSLIPYVISNIFIFGETHHELLKNTVDINE